MILAIRHLHYFGKFFLKYILLRLIDDYSFWKKLEVFDHGKMDTTDYSIGTFNFFYGAFTKQLGRSFQDITLMEIGPGDSVALGVLAKLRGARRSFLVDSGNFATKDMSFYSNLIKQESSMESFDEMLARYDIDYGTTGLDSLRKIKDNSVDLIVSNAVLEHITPELLSFYSSEFTRILSVQGVMIHRIDYRDHLTGGKFHNSLPLFLSNSKFYQQSIMYLNNLSEEDYVKIFLKNGFQIQIIDRKNLIYQGGGIHRQRSRSKNFTSEVASSCLICVRV